jgi:hypothetical protein
LQDIDRLVAKVERVSQKVNHASYGYTGFFDVVKVKEENLDRMIEFDSNLIEDAEGLMADVDAFRVEVTKSEAKNAKEQIQSIVDKLDSFEETLDKRQEVILGAV